MPTLNIQGQKVKVDDSFLSLSPEEQNATVEEIAGSLGIQAQGQNQQGMQADQRYDKTRTFLGGMAEGIPIVGPFVREASDIASAAIISATGPETYDEVREQLSQDKDRLKEENPTTDFIGSVSGSIAGMAPIVATAPALFGANASAGLFTNTAISAGSGGAISVADSAIRSGGDTDAMWDAGMWGLGLGALGPASGKIAGAAVRKASDKLANMKAAKSTGINNKALDSVTRAVADDGLDTASITAKLDDLGPDAMLMDLGPNLKQQAGAIVATPSRGQDIVKSAINSRNMKANERILTALDDTLGKAKVPSELTGQINAGKEALSEVYDAAFSNAKPVDLTHINKVLLSAGMAKRGPAQSAARNLRKMLFVGKDSKAKDKILTKDPVTLFEIRQAIDGKYATTKNPKVKALLTRIRKYVDEELASKVPDLKKVDAQYAELARQQDAVTRGQQVLEGGRTAPRPSELSEEVSKGSIPSGEMVGPSAVPLRMSQGARAEIERIVGNNANDRVALQRIVKGDGDWNRSRLATLFGDSRTDRILNVLEAEKVFADTSHIVTGNSQTAARQAAQAEINPNANQGFGVKESYLSGGQMGAVRAMGLKAANKIIESLGASRQTINNEQLANILTSGDKAQIAKILTMANDGVPIEPSKINEIVSTILLGLGVSSGRPQALPAP